MRALLMTSAFVLAACSFSGSVFAEEKSTLKCPEVTPKEINALQQSLVITFGSHKWYMQDAYHLPESLGNHIPLSLSVEEVINPQKVSYKQQLDARTCQYDMVLSNGQSGVITFKLVGD